MGVKQNSSVTDWQAERQSVFVNNYQACLCENVHNPLKYVYCLAETTMYRKKHDFYQNVIDVHKTHTYLITSKAI